MSVNIEKLKSACEEYDKLEGQAAKAKAEYERVLSLKSECVKVILDANDGQKKLNRNGKLLTIAVRGDTHFFRNGKNDGEITSI